MSNDRAVLWPVPASTDVLGLAVHGTDVIVLASSKVVAVPKSGGTARTIASLSPATGGGRCLVVDAEYAYWAVGFLPQPGNAPPPVLQRAPLAGGNPETLATGALSPPGGSIKSLRQAARPTAAH